MWSLDLEVLAAVNVVVILNNRLFTHHQINCSKGKASKINGRMIFNLKRFNNARVI